MVKEKIFRFGQGSTRKLLELEQFFVSEETLQVSNMNNRGLKTCGKESGSVNNSPEWVEYKIRKIRGKKDVVLLLQCFSG